MKHPRVATGVLFRISLILLLLPLMAALGGCSLFGIATKGNLNELAEQQEQQNQQVLNEVHASEQKMDLRVTEVEDTARRIDQDLIRYESEIQSAKMHLQAIKMDMDLFEENLDRAASNSKQALRIQHESVISERDRLRQRLNEIDALILGWEQQRMLEPVGNMTPIPGGLIVPEKELESDGATSAASASNETSVWRNRNSGGSSR